MRRQEKEKERKKFEAQQAQKDRENMVKSCGSGDNWLDITGLYKIKCAYIKDIWSSDVPRDGMTLEIQRCQTREGWQMYAVFDFGVIKGVFRFERQASDKQGNPRQYDEYWGQTKACRI